MMRITLFLLSLAAITCLGCEHRIHEAQIEPARSVAPLADAQIASIRQPR